MSLFHRPRVDIAAAQFRLDADLLMAQVLVESAGRADAFRYESSFYTRYLLGQPIAAGAHLAPYGPLLACSYGLLQILAIVAYELGFHGRPEELFLPEVGLHWGCRKFRSLLDWADGNADQALAAYNGGKGSNFAPPYRNQGYVNKVRAMEITVKTPSGILDV